MLPSVFLVSVDIDFNHISNTIERNKITIHYAKLRKAILLYPKSDC